MSGWHTQISAQIETLRADHDKVIEKVRGGIYISKNIA